MRRSERTIDDLVAAVFSLSGSTPHLFGDGRDEFGAKLRESLFSIAAPAAHSANKWARWPWTSGDLRW